MGAVRQISKQELRRLAEEKGQAVELLPSKMVFTRKAGSGWRRARAVCCGNFQSQVEEGSTYAGGVDSVTVRMALRWAALQSWTVATLDVKTAFLNAPRTSPSIVATEVPQVMRQLGFGTGQEVWLIVGALYGLVTSPRDWQKCRDEQLPRTTWIQNGEPCYLAPTNESNLWLVKKNRSTVGLMLVYVDDFLIVGEDETVHLAVRAIEAKWTCSKPTYVSQNESVTFCGIEIRHHEESQGIELTQQAYEQELLERWPQQRTSPQIQLKVPQPDAEDEDDATIEEIREAQALTGALLWLSTRCRPELSFPVHVMAKHAVKKPGLTIANGHSIIRYLQSQRGGLIYAGASWNGEWGPRQQLLARRRNYLMEVYSDVSYASAPGWKSTSGVAVYVAGAIIAWMTSSQPFVTQSTAEAELVGLSEANLCGQSVQGLLEEMLELKGSDKNLEIIMYGDNSASIGMVSGSTGASWRTRHLRIRAACLRQSLEAKGWLLRHLRGTELVADGMTKQLSGQPWERFIEDLGGVRGAVPTTLTTSTTSTGELPSTSDVEQITGEKTDAKEIQQHLAMKAMAIGGLLIASGSETQDENKAWVGAQLMAVGWRSLQAASNRKEVGSTSGECLGEAVEEQVIEKPVLKVMRERSRSRDDRDRDQPPQGEQQESEDHQAPAENAGGEASGSTGDGAGPAGAFWATAGGSTGMTSEERTARNEEMAELTSQSNVAMFSRDSGMMADSVMMEDEEWSVHSGREVEFDLQPGDEDPRIAIEALLARERPPEENERRRRQALERGRDQAVDEAMRRLGIPDPAQQDQTPDDPNVAAEVLNPDGAENLNQDGVENLNPEGAEAADPDEGEEESHETSLSELLDRMVDMEEEPQAFLVIRDTVTNINGSWLLRPTARRTILTYLMKYPREESDEGVDLASLQAIRESLASEEEEMKESILTANLGMRKVLRRMGFNVAEPGEENRDTDEDHDPMRELPTPTEETCDPERESKVKPRKAMLFDGPEQPIGPETPEERRRRLVRESLIAQSRMQVFKTYYNRNKKNYMEMKKELGEGSDGQETFEFETFDEQGNAHVVEVDEECDYSPTSAGGEVPEPGEVPGPVGPTPPSEPGGSGPGSQGEEKPRSEPTGSEGSEGKGSKKGKSHRTWRSETPERMRREDFVALKHPRAPWPVFIDEEQENWWVPGAYSQNYVLLEDAEARRAEMDMEDDRFYDEEEWQRLPPWRQERIRELRRKKGKSKGQSTPRSRGVHTSQMRGRTQVGQLAGPEVVVSLR